VAVFQKTVANVRTSRLVNKFEHFLAPNRAAVTAVGASELTAVAQPKASFFAVAQSILSATGGTRCGESRCRFIQHPSIDARRAIKPVNSRKEQIHEKNIV
jgi:hypothetical protein